MFVLINSKSYTKIVSFPPINQLKNILSGYNLLRLRTSNINRSKKKKMKMALL